MTQVFADRRVCIKYGTKRRTRHRGWRAATCFLGCVRLSRFTDSFVQKFTWSLWSQAEVSRRVVAWKTCDSPCISFASASATRFAAFFDPITFITILRILKRRLSQRKPFHLSFISIRRLDFLRELICNSIIYVAVLYSIL